MGTEVGIGMKSNSIEYNTKAKANWPRSKCNSQVKTKRQPGYLVAVKTLRDSREMNRDALLKEAAVMAQFTHERVTYVPTKAALNKSSDLLSIVAKDWLTWLR